MSRIRAIASNIETVVEAVTPETKFSAATFRHVVGASSQLQLRQFAIGMTGGVRWFDEYPQDQPGSLVAEDFEIIIGYPASDPGRNIRDAIREDVLAIQHALLDPDNWDDDTLRSDQRTLSGYRVDFDADGQNLKGIEVTIPVTVRYRPF